MVELNSLVFIDSTDGNELSGAASIRRRAGFIGKSFSEAVFWWERGGVVGRILNRSARRLPQWDHMGPGCWSTSAGQCGGECYTLAVNVEMGPVLHSHSSQMPLYSVPPPFIPPFGLPLFPPSINDPFVWVFFTAVGWRASAGPVLGTLLKPFLPL